MLRRSQLPGGKIAIIGRQSDPYKTNTKSVTSQLAVLENESEELHQHLDHVEVVLKFRLNESASTMDRESMNKIIEYAKNDMLDILMVWKIHRLTRTNLLDTFRFILKLEENGVILYSHDYGYFDWDDNEDTHDIMEEAFLAWKWANDSQRRRISAWNSWIWTNKGIYSTRKSN
jgi:DNA invertase Pin-like site-specific DNA recombinase